MGLCIALCALAQVPTAWAGAVAESTWQPRSPVPLGDRLPSAFTIAPLSGRAARSARRARVEMLDRARRDGWPVLGAESLGPDRTVEARFVLGGELRDSERIRFGGVPGHAVEVWWQLVDRRHDQVLYEVSTLGWASNEQGIPSAMSSAFDQVLARDSFVDALEQAGRGAFLERVQPVELRRCTETHATTTRQATVSVRQGSNTGTGVIVSPDGWVWTAAHLLPEPHEPILVNTPSGRLPARWVAADADADVALLALPLEEPTGCAPRAARIPHVQQTLRSFTAQRRGVDLAISGFRLQQRPPQIVVEAPAALAPSPVYDQEGSLVGMRAAAYGADVVRPHHAISDALGIFWSDDHSTVPAPSNQRPVVDRPDPGFAAPPRR